MTTGVSSDWSALVDADVEFSWTEEEVADLYDNTEIIIAADGRL